jgi:hypothetical protein
MFDMLANGQLMLANGQLMLVNGQLMLVNGQFMLVKRSTDECEVVSQIFGLVHGFEFA